jgi:hypothetical protein
MTSRIIELLSDQHTPNLDIVDQILVNLNIADIFALHATCRRLSWVVRQMTESPYLLNINKQLLPFAKDPSRFRSELGKCDGLIRGGPAQNFLTFGSPTSSTLHIFANDRSKAEVEVFTKYLEKDEGYSRSKERWLNQVFKRENPLDVTIYVEKTLEPPIITIIKRAQTTADLTFVSWNKVYCLLPSLTIKRHKFLLLQPFDEEMAAKLREYASCGWTTRDLLTPGQTRQPIPLQGLQQVGGPESLVIDLPNPPEGDFKPDDVIENSTFSLALSEDNRNHPYPHLTIGVTLMIDRMLRHAFACGEKSPASKSWKEFLLSRLDHWAYVDLVKLEPEKRPFSFFFRKSISDYDPEILYDLPTVDYADDQVSIWFQEWKSENKALM